MSGSQDGPQQGGQPQDGQPQGGQSQGGQPPQNGRTRGGQPRGGRPAGGPGQQFGGPERDTYALFGVALFGALALGSVVNTFLNQLIVRGDLDNILFNLTSSGYGGALNFLLAFGVGLYFYFNRPSATDPERAAGITAVAGSFVVAVPLFVLAALLSGVGFDTSEQALRLLIDILMHGVFAALPALALDRLDRVP